jgi:O-antigen ligase
MKAYRPSRSIQDPATRLPEHQIAEPGLTRLNTIALGALLVFVTLAPLIVSDAGDGSTTAGEGNALRQLIYLTIFALALFSAQVAQSPSRLLSLPPSLCAMLAWCFLSVSWAVDPGVAVRRLFLTLIIIWSVFLLVEKAGYERTLSMVRWVLLLILIANYVAVVLAPSWAIHQAASEKDPSIVGAWRGILMQKNFAGVACVLSILFYLFDAKKIVWPLRLAVVSAAAVFLYHSNSRTSILLLVSSIAGAGMYRLYEPAYRWITCLFLQLGILLFSVLAWEYWDVLIESFDTPDTLTGRPLIWSVLFRYWQDHWLLGSGFGSFWNVGDPEPISSYSRGWVANSINSGHNGFLDIMVQTGFPGLLLAIFAVVLVPLASFIVHPSLDRSRASLLLVTIWFCIFHNFTESSLFDRDATVHVFLMLAIALLRAEARRR